MWQLNVWPNLAYAQIVNTLIVLLSVLCTEPFTGEQLLASLHCYSTCLLYAATRCAKEVCGNQTRGISMAIVCSNIATASNQSCTTCT